MNTNIVFFMPHKPSSGFNSGKPWPRVASPDSRVATGCRSTRRAWVEVSRAWSAPHLLLKYPPSMKRVCLATLQAPGMACWPLLVCPCQWSTNSTQPWTRSWKKERSKLSCSPKDSSPCPRQRVSSTNSFQKTRTNGPKWSKTATPSIKRFASKTLGTWGIWSPSFQKETPCIFVGIVGKPWPFSLQRRGAPQCLRPRL